MSTSYQKNRQLRCDAWNCNTTRCIYAVSGLKVSIYLWVFLRLLVQQVKIIIMSFPRHWSLQWC